MPIPPDNPARAFFVYRVVSSKLELASVVVEEMHVWATPEMSVCARTSWDKPQRLAELNPYRAVAHLVVICRTLGCAQSDVRAWRSWRLV